MTFHIPVPIDIYQSLEPSEETYDRPVFLPSLVISTVSVFKVRPVCPHRVCSLACVPLSSPLDTNLAPEPAIFLNASAGLFTPLIPAGSPFGPMIIKSLCMTARRYEP